MSKLIAALALSFVSITAAQAMTHPPTSWWQYHQKKYDHGGSGWSRGDPLAAPEIDPASGVAGLTLLIGGLAVLRGRGNKR